MLIRRTGIGVTLTATLVLGTSLFAAEERFSFAIAGVQAGEVTRAYARTDAMKASVMAPERLNFSISRYASDAERDRLFSIASSEGTGKVPDVLQEMTRPVTCTGRGAQATPSTTRDARFVPMAVATWC